MGEFALIRDRNHCWSICPRDLIEGGMLNETVNLIRQGEWEFTGLMIASFNPEHGERGDMDRILHQLNTLPGTDLRIIPYHALSPEDQKQALKTPGMASAPDRA